jgi:hypothetical protein
MPAYADDVFWAYDSMGRERHGPRTEWVKDGNGQGWDLSMVAWTDECIMADGGMVGFWHGPWLYLCL